MKITLCNLATLILIKCVIIIIIIIIITFFPIFNSSADFFYCSCCFFFFSYYSKRVGGNLSASIVSSFCHIFCLSFFVIVLWYAV